MLFSEYTLLQVSGKCGGYASSASIFNYDEQFCTNPGFAIFKT